MVFRIDRWFRSHYRLFAAGVNMFFIAVSPYSTTDDATVADKNSNVVVEEQAPSAQTPAAQPSVMEQGVRALSGLGDVLTGDGDEEAGGDDAFESSLYDHYLAKAPVMPHYQPTSAQTFLPISGSATAVAEQRPPATSYEDVMDAYLDRVEKTVQDDGDYIGALTELDKALIIDPLNRRVHHLKALVTEKIKRELSRERAVQDRPLGAQVPAARLPEPEKNTVTVAPAATVQTPVAPAAQAPARTTVDATTAVAEERTAVAKPASTLADAAEQALRDAEKELLNDATRKAKETVYEPDVASQLFVEEPVVARAAAEVAPAESNATVAVLPKADTVAEALAQLDPFEKKKIEDQAARMKDELLSAAAEFEKLETKIDTLAGETVPVSEQTPERVLTEVSSKPAENETTSETAAVAIDAVSTKEPSAVKPPERTEAATVETSTPAPVQQPAAAVAPVSAGADDGRALFHAPVERYIKRGKRYFKKKNYALALITFSKAQEYDVHRVYENELNDLVKLTKQRLEVMAAK